MLRFILNIYERKSNALGVILSYILVIIMLSPMLKSGYISDDSINSFTKGFLLENQQSLFEFSLSIIKSWIHNNGRFFPLAFYDYSVFSIINNLYLYKVSILIVILINITLFAYLIKILTKSLALSSLSILLLPLLFQFRLYHDPILSFCWLQQIVFLLILTSLISLWYYISTSKNKFLILSMILYALSLLTYETTYVFFILHFVIVFLCSDKNNYYSKLKTSSSFFLVALLFILISLCIRMHYGIPLSGGGNETYIANMNFANYFMTLMRQTCAAFPLSYLIFDPHNIFKDILINFNYQNLFASLIIIIVYVLLFLEISRKAIGEFSVLKEREYNTSNAKILLVLGILLIILPGVLISLSPKFQMEIKWGLGYLPVYMSYFGLAMTVLSIIYLFYRKLSLLNKNKYIYIYIVVIAVVLGCINAINYNNNKIVIEHSNSFWLYPRTIIEDGIKRGILQDVKDESFLLVNTNHSWDMSAFYRMYSNKFKYVGVKGKYIEQSLFSDTNSKQFDQYYSSDFFDLDNVYYLNYNSSSNDNGYVVLGKINKCLVSNNEIYGVDSGKAYIYVRMSKDPDAINSVSVKGRWIDPDELNYSEPFNLGKGDMELISYGKGWGLFTISKVGRQVDMLSLSIDENTKESKLSIYWEPKSANDLLLKDDKNVLIHVGFENELMLGIEVKPLNLPQSYTIQLVVKPFKNQVAYASIVGNHPGYNYYEGFVIQQDNQNQNVYNFGFGNGKEWLPKIAFKLNEDEWNYIAIVVNKNIIKGFNNGLPVAFCDAKDIIKNSAMPFCIGNWINKDRPFNGLIDEIKISDGFLLDEDIQLNWQLVKDKKYINVK